MTAATLLDQLIVEDIDQLDCPGIAFWALRTTCASAWPRAQTSGKSSRLQELDGSEERRISLLPQRVSADDKQGYEDPKGRLIWKNRLRILPLPSSGP